MDLRRLRIGEWILAASGIALLVSLFLPWYAAAGSAAREGWTAYAPLDAAVEMTAWESFPVVDIVLALIAAAAVAVLLITATQAVSAVPIALESLVALGGIAAAVLVLIRALDLPDGAAGREWGIWLGLAGALGIAVGGIVAMRDERLSPPGRHTDHTGRPAPPPGQIESLPAPTREGTA